MIEENKYGVDRARAIFRENRIKRESARGREIETERQRQRQRQTDRQRC